MAKTLRETLQQQLEQPPQAPALGQTEEAQRLLRAKSGKAAAPGATPRRSAMQERMAQQQTIAAGKQQQAAGALAGLGLQEQEAAVEQQQQEQLANLEQRQLDIDSAFSRRADEIVDQLSRGQKELGAQKYAAGLEKLGTVARLQNSKYISDLSRS